MYLKILISIIFSSIFINNNNNIKTSRYLVYNTILYYTISFTFLKLTQNSNNMSLLKSILEYMCAYYRNRYLYRNSQRRSKRDFKFHHSLT